MSEAGERGFTLFEMLVVLAVLGLVSGLIWPALGGAMRGQALRGAGAGVAATLAAARARAIRADAPVMLSQAGFGAMPAGVRVAVTPAGGIGFFADGSSTGGAVAVGDGGRALRYAVSATGIATAVTQ